MKKSTRKLHLDDRWITIGPKDTVGKKHGVHVMIDEEGEILKGPKSFMGQNVAELSVDKKKESENALGGLNSKSSKEEWSEWLKNSPVGSTVVKYSKHGKKKLEYRKNKSGKWRNVADKKELLEEVEEFTDADKLAETLTGGGKISIKNKAGEKWNVGSETVKQEARGYSIADAYKKAGIDVDSKKVEAAASKMPEHIVFDEPELKEFMQHVWAGYHLPIKVLKKTSVYRNLENKRKQAVADYGYTIAKDPAKRKPIRDKVFRRFMKNGAWSGKGKDETGKPVDLYDGTINKGRKAVIVIGYPAAGKSSSIVNKISQNEGAFVLDSDAIKEMLPEFQKSKGAAVSCVNKEANTLRKRVLAEFARGGSREGDNLVIPIIGDTKESIQYYIDQLEPSGYDVEIQFKKAPLEQSANRMVSRAIETGRIIPLEALDENADLEQIFDSFKAKGMNAKGLPYVRTAAQ